MKDERELQEGTGERTDQQSGEPEEKSGNPVSRFYRMWISGKKKADKDKPADLAEAAEGDFVRQISVADPEENNDWLDEEAPEGDDLKVLFTKWKRSRNAKEHYAPLRLWQEENGEGLLNEQNEMTAFLTELQRAARVMLSAQAYEGGEERFRDASFSLRVSSDAMTVWIFMFAPRQNGADIREEDIRKGLKEQGIIFGVESERIKRLADDKMYFQVIRIASGTRPIDGKDGTLIECIPRESTIETAKKPDGTVDYRSLGKIQQIHQGDIICRLEPPTEMVCGMNVKGAQVRGREGRPAELPRIENTQRSEDGMALLSSIDGRIYYENNKFVVDKLLVIDGNVDTSVGNLDFRGDILITGDVLEGFEIKASGNITIRGMAQNAVIRAGGNIIIGKGMNGDGVGILEAKKEIHSKFLENCNVLSGGGIFADCVVWSDISCNGNLIVNTDKGAIVGGSIAVLHNIEAVSIGNLSQRPTKIVLGSTPQLLAEKEQLEKQLEAIQSELEGVIKDIRFLEGRSLGEKQKAQLDQRRLRKPLLLMQERQTAKRLDEIYESITGAHDSRIRCQVVYPQTRISIGASSMIVEHVHYNCNIFGTKEKIVIGQV